MPENRNIKLIVEYDGTDFYGFQSQPVKPTIQQALEKALHGLFQEKIKITAASGRTDAGVHAEAQVVNFKTTSELLLHRVERGLNHFLPDSISVLSAEEVSADFHARFHAISKTYEYRIWNLSARPAIWRNRAYHESAPLDLALMKKAAKYLIGKHDFRAFTSEEKIVKSRDVRRDQISFIRTVKKITLKKMGHMIVMSVEADGFLYHMVRNFAGTLVAVGKGKLRPQDIKTILKSHDRKKAAETLPAHGLCLKKVIYSSGTA